MKTYAGIALAFVAGLASERVVAEGVPALACSGCSVAQEQQKALAAPNTAHGYSVVFNVKDKRIHKFEAVVPSGGRTAPLGGKAYGGTRVVSSDAGARELWEYPVDPSAMKVFDAIVSLESLAPGFLAGKSAVAVPIRTLGPVSDEANAPLHDPRLIAWHWPPSGGSAHHVFDERVDRIFDDAATLGRFDGRVAKALFDVQRASKTAGLSIGRAGLAVGVDFEGVAKALKVKVCDDDDTCVQMSTTFNDFPTYENVIDKYGVALPMMHGRTFRVEWPANARDGAYAQAGWLRANRQATTIDDKTGGKTTCGGYVLACERADLAPKPTCRLECR